MIIILSDLQCCHPWETVRDRRAITDGHETKSILRRGAVEAGESELKIRDSLIEKSSIRDNRLGVACLSNPSSRFGDIV